MKGLLISKQNWTERKGIGFEDLDKTIKKDFIERLMSLLTLVRLSSTKSKVLSKVKAFAQLVVHKKVNANDLL